MDVTIDFLHEESEALQTVIGMLRGAGDSQTRIDEAVLVLQQRLRLVKARREEETGEAAGRGSNLQPEWPEGQQSLSARGTESSPYASLVGKSDAIQEVYRAIRRVSESQATVLLRGESGTGKELAAKAIHVQSPRARGPFVRLHCAALSEALLESELFGHERGAFTGAVETRKGRFEQADGGTLFLDEVGDIPLSTQVKLLRVLQERAFERVGGSRPIEVDVRLISATHRDLEAMVRNGTFREDLYYRINVVPIVLPPLRERRGDISLLIGHFLSKFNRDNRRHVRLDRRLLNLMESYHWTGNVRELQNCIERLVVMSEAESVSLDSVPASLRAYFSDMKHVTLEPRVRPTGKHEDPLSLGASLQEIERTRLEEALVRAGGNQAKAARYLGLTPRQVAYKIRKYAIPSCEGQGME